MMGFTGDLWTVGPLLRRRLAWPSAALPSAPWSVTVDDPAIGPVRLTGRLFRGGDESVIIIVHGLGGSIASACMGASARAAVAAGCSVLLLNMRGADRSGEDVYHAALTADLHAAAASPALAPFTHLHVLGFSLGGHLALRYAAEPGDPRLATVAAVCSPLDLADCARHIDAPRSWVYRRYLLEKLQEIYAAVAERRAMPVPIERVRAARRLQEFDGLAIAPRHGFASAADYYRQASAGPVIDRLRAPALFLAAEADPLVPAAGSRAFLPLANGHLEVHWLPIGGHLGFPNGLDLGSGGPPGVEGQAVAWMLRQAGTPEDSQLRGGLAPARGF